MNTSHEPASSTLSHRIASLTTNLKDVAEHVSSAASQLKRKAGEARTHAAARTSSIAASAGRLIKDHPVAVIGFVLGSGYLLIRLLRR